VATGPATFHSWASGRELEGRGGLRAVVNPSTGEPFAQASLLDAAQAGEAIGAAQAAFPGWSRTSFAERVRLLDDRGAADDRARADNSARPDLHSGSDHGIGPNAHVGADRVHAAAAELLSANPLYPGLTL